MSYKIQKPLPTVAELHKKHPVSLEARKQIDRDRIEIQDILAGRDSRKICIVGPCSAWPSEAVARYFEKLKSVADEVSEKLKLVGRVYIQKPRTALGWLGPVNQPDPAAPADIERGIEYCRKMMLEVIDLGFPIADEALFTQKKGYLLDLYSWVAIGARSTEDQEHRIFASMVDCPVGMKNPTSGNIEIATNSIVAAQNSHVFVIDGQQIETSGNPFAHLILRGGGGKPNFQFEKLRQTVAKLREKKVKNPAIIVDASHDNSIDPATGAKNPLLQPAVIFDTLESAKKDPEIATAVKGFMIESFLEDGKQKFDPENLKFGQSITDSCLGIEKTADMLRKLASRI